MRSRSAWWAREQMCRRRSLVEISKAKVSHFFSMVRIHKTYYFADLHTIRQRNTPLTTISNYTAILQQYFDETTLEYNQLNCKRNKSFIVNYEFLRIYSKISHKELAWCPCWKWFEQAPCGQTIVGEHRWTQPESLPFGGLIPYDCCADFNLMLFNFACVYGMQKCCYGTQIACYLNAFFFSKENTKVLPILFLFCCISRI